jgi:hypothetical protein
LAGDKKNPEVLASTLSPMWARTIFPDAQGIFSAVQPPAEEIKKTCFVVLDANVLLLPYKMENVSLAEIVKVYERLTKAGRLVIPPQAAREFAKHRSSKVGDVVKYLREQASLSGPLLNKKVGSLENHEGYRSAKAMVEDVKTKVRELQKAISAVADGMAANVGDEPVSIQYRRLFSKAVCNDPPECDDEAALKRELADRYAMSRPPGYKDQDKEDGGAGDLIIWKTILAEGLSRKLDCIFVTADQKPDWYVQAGGAFQARFELLEEYRCVVGKTIHVMPLSRLLSLFEAPEGIIENVRGVESSPVMDSFSDNNYNARFRSREIKALEDDLRSTEKSIRLTEAQLQNMPPFDGNMSLPWNRATRQIQSKLENLILQREEILSEFMIVDPDFVGVHSPNW